MSGYKKITRQELKDLLWEAHDVLDQKQREMILDSFPEGTSSMIYFHRTISKMHEMGYLSSIDYERLKELAEKYY